MKRKTAVTAVVALGLIIIGIGVVLAAGEVVDDFEDGDTTDTLSANWGSWQDPGGVFSATSDSPLSGSYSGLISVSGISRYVTVERTAGDKAIRNVSVLVRTDASPSTNADGMEIQLEEVDSGDEQALIVFRGGSKQNVTVGGGTEAVEIYDGWKTNVTYEAVIYDVNYSDNSFRGKVINHSDGTVLGDGYFHYSTPNVDYSDQIKITNDMADGGSANMRIDDVKVDEKKSYTVSGTVNDAGGSEVDGATVYFNQSGSNVAKDTTSSDGSYSVSVTNGDYDVTIRHDDYPDTTETVTVDGADLTRDFTLGSTSSSATLDYTLGVCYTTDARFDADSATAGWEEGAQSGGSVLSWTALGTGKDTTEFDTAGNTSNTLSGNEDLRFRATVVTDRAYYEIQGINPGAGNLYDLFTFSPPFEPTEGVSSRDCAGGDTSDDGNLYPVVTFDTEPSPPAVGEPTELIGNVTDPDGTIESHTWTIDNETTYSGETASHTFTEAGEHTIKLAATDDDGLTASYERTVTAGGEETNTSKPTAGIDWSPFVPEEGQEVTFEAVNAEDPDGEIVSYEWEIGASDPVTGQEVTGSFQNAGVYEVALTLEDDDGAERVIETKLEVIENDSSTENVKPFALFSWDPIAPATGETVTFTSDSSDLDGTIESLKWEFPDGTVKRGDQVTMTFDEEGSKLVELTALDDDGGEATYSAEVEVGGEGSNIPPTTWFEWEPLSPDTNETVTLTADSSDPDGQVVENTWTLPNGSTATGEEISLSFDETGNHEIVLEATDDQGATAEYAASIDVNDALGIDGPSAIGTCTVPGENGSQTGLEIEYWDPTYNTSTLTWNLTWDGEAYNGTRVFAEPKGYFYGCVNVGEIDPSGEGGGEVGDGGNIGGGGGGFFAEDTGGSGAPLWLVAGPAVAALGYVGYRRYSGSGGQGAASEVTARLRGRGGS